MCVAEVPMVQSGMQSARGSKRAMPRMQAQLVIGTLTGHRCPSDSRLPSRLLSTLGSRALHPTTRHRSMASTIYRLFAMITLPRAARWAALCYVVHCLLPSSANAYRDPHRSNKEFKVDFTEHGTDYDHDTVHGSVTIRGGGYTFHVGHSKGVATDLSCLLISG